MFRPCVGYASGKLTRNIPCSMRALTASRRFLFHRPANPRFFFKYMELLYFSPSQQRLPVRLTCARPQIRFCPVTRTKPGTRTREMCFVSLKQ